MLTITKKVTSEYFHTLTDLIDCSKIWDTKVSGVYDTEYDTSLSIGVLFSIWVYAYALFFKINSFRCQCLLSYLCKDLISKTESWLLNYFLLWFYICIYHRIISK